jgi:iron complex outermembrane receptor protein
VRSDHQASCRFLYAWQRAANCFIGGEQLMYRYTRQMSCAPALLLALAVGPGAPTAEAQGGTQASREAQALEEIVVTARKREESVRDIPTSIDAFSGARLESLGYNNVEAIVKLSPGVSFEAGFTPSSTSIIVRGITNDSRGVGPRTVGRFYDNVPLTNPSIMGVEPDLDTFDMRTVEVLKGPQGTLFGGSALAGAIRYQPNAPELGAWQGAASAGIGWVASSSDNNTDYALMVNAPLSDSFAVRFAGSVRNFAGYIDDTRSGEEDINSFRAKQGRVMAKWQPNESLSLEASYLKYEGDLGAFNWIEGIEPVRERTKRSVDDFELSNVDMLGFRGSWDSGAFSTVFEANSLEKERDQTNDVTIFVGLFGTGITVGQNFLEATDQDSYELRVVSNEPSAGDGLFGNWQYTAGLFFLDSEQTRPVVITLNFPTATNQQGGGAVVSAEEKAVFFDLTRTFGEGFELNLGGRYFSQVTEGGTFVDFAFSSANPGGLPDNISFVPKTNGFSRLKEDGFNPKAAIRWFASPNVTAIASYAKGFRFGGINGDKLVLENAIFQTNVDIPFTFGSDEIDNWELGLRTSWLDGRVTADGTLFLVDWKNLQVLQRAGVFAFTDNVGGAEVKGVEFALNALLSDSWSMLLNASYQNAKTSEDFQSGEFGFVPSGTVLPNAPKWTGAAQLRYQGAVGSTDVDGSLTYAFRSSSSNNLINSIPLDAYGTLDFSVGVQLPAFRLKPRLSLVARNLTDERAAIFGFKLAGRDPVISINQPRQIGLKLDVVF